MRILPIAGANLPLARIMAAFPGLFTNNKYQLLLKNEIFNLIDKNHIFFLNSGLASFYLILKCLKKKSERTEVILPAYTAGSLVVAIKKAGLKPVLCDISMNDFNMDRIQLEKIVTGQTLAIVGVHMFGIVSRYYHDLINEYPNVHIIEDCAQAFGSKYRGKMVGNLTNTSFFSFNRGKNLPTFSGGCIATNDNRLAQLLTREMQNMPQMSTRYTLDALFKMLMLAVIINPLLYGIFFKILNRFKELKPPNEIDMKTYSDLQAKMALDLLKIYEKSAKARYRNGIKIIAALKERPGFILPKVNEYSWPVFNRFPLVVTDNDRKFRLEKNLFKAGFETSRMYMQPLHHMFKLGYEKNDFPKAKFLAENLITLPVHPLMKEKHIEKMTSIITRT